MPARFVLTPPSSFLPEVLSSDRATLNEIEFDLRRFQDGELELFSGVVRRAARAGDAGQTVALVTVPPPPHSPRAAPQKAAFATPRAPPATPGALAASRLVEATGRITLDGIGIMSPRLKKASTASVGGATPGANAGATAVVTGANVSTTAVATLLSPSLAVLGGRPARQRGAAMVSRVPDCVAESLILLEAPKAAGRSAGWAAVSCSLGEGENAAPAEKALKGRGSRPSSRAASAGRD